MLQPAPRHARSAGGGGGAPREAWHSHPRRAGLSATVVVPHGNSVEKNAAMRSLGANLIEHGVDFQAALEDGSLEFDRWQSYQKLQRERAYAARKTHPRLARETKADWRRIHKAQREAYRLKYGE